MGLRHQPLSQPTEQVVRCPEVSSAGLRWHYLEHFQNHLLPQATPVQTEMCNLVAEVTRRSLKAANNLQQSEPCMPVIHVHTIRHTDLLSV